MRFLEIAQAFATLEATRSRLRMVELVADLLRRCGARERERLVYLLQGQLRPAWAGLEVGVGERMLVTTLARRSGSSETAVTRRLGRLGDLGLVAEALAADARGRPVTLTQAYAGLLAIARTAGPGSVELKLGRLAALLGRAQPIEARYLVRIAQGRLRLGLGDQTILEAAALGALGARHHKALLERAYNVRSDLGAVVATAYTRGAKGLARLAPEPGIPVRPALAQRLPSARAIIARLGTVQVEPKYDGLRLQVHRDGSRVWIFSRRLENVTGMFPELAGAARRQLRPRRVIIEGEAVAYNPETGEFLPFQVTMTRKRKTGIGQSAERYPLRLFAFDLLYSGRHGCLDWSQRRRSRVLHRMVRHGEEDAIEVTEPITTGRVPKLEARFEEMIHRGLEGIVAKRPDAPYRAGARGYDWVKLKRAYQPRLRDTVDLVVVGYTRGRGKRAALGIGSLLAAVYDPAGDRFRTVARVGSGLSETAWRELRGRLDADALRSRPRTVDTRITTDVWVVPRVVLEVLADEITRSPVHTCGRSGTAPGYGLRFPRVVRERADKAPEDATTEAEILRLHRMQGRSTHDG